MLLLSSGPSAASAVSMGICILQQLEIDTTSPFLQLSRHRPPTCIHSPRPAARDGLLRNNLIEMRPRVLAPDEHRQQPLEAEHAEDGHAVPAQADEREAQHLE